MERINVQIKSVASRNGQNAICLNILVAGANQDVSCEVNPTTMQKILLIVNRDPFPKKKIGELTYHIISVTEGGGTKKGATIEIRKGRSRVKRELTIPRELFILLWNVFHFRSLPNNLPDTKRKH
jgi:hypothetical protein